MKWLAMCAFLVGCGTEKIVAEPFRAPPDAGSDAAVEMPGVDSGPQERAIVVTMVSCAAGTVTLDVPGKLAADLVGTTVCAHRADGTITCPHDMVISDGRIVASSLVCSPNAINPADYLLFAVPR